MKPVANIEISGLSKQYSGTNKAALDDLSLSVYPGEVYGFLGPNGAGKSTTIRLLMGFLKPSSGSAKILSHDIMKNNVQVKKSIGYLSGDGAMYSRMTGQQFIDYMCELLPATSKSYVDQLTKRLRADLDKRLGDLSRGNRQKINLIQAFMHQPKVLILDEPTSGLDPLMQEVFYDLIGEAKVRGASVFTSSHILGEVQKMCDRVGIIRDGKLVDERRIDDLAHEAAQTFDIAFAGPAPITKIKKIKGVRLISSDRDSVTIHLHGKLAPLFAELARHDVIKIDARNLDLEEVFMRFYQSKGDKK